MKNLEIKSLGPIRNANVEFGDLTLLVGPQASGKSIFIQLLKLAVDRKHIRKTLEQYNFVWGKKRAEVLDRYFGEGMHGIWNDNTKIIYDGKSIDTRFLLPSQNERYSEAEELLFYIPAQRILSLSDGRAKYFTEFDETAPYVLRHFSETLRLLMQDINNQNSVFPQAQRLKEPLRESFNESIFHNGEIMIDNVSGQKRLRMKIDGMSIPFMTWSAGQKEFMPLLLSFYWLCPPSKISTRESIKYVVIEEPEMGLHPKAIRSILLQIMDLLARGYKVVVSTHSPVLLEFAWALRFFQENNAGYKSLKDLFEINKTPPSVKKMFNSLLEEKAVNTYYFERGDSGVQVKNITSLDAGSEDSALAEWGGLSSFSSKAIDIVSNIAANG